MTFNRNNTRTNIFTWLWPASLVTLLTPRGRTEGQRQGQGQGQRQGQGEKTFRGFRGSSRFYGFQGLRTKTTVRIWVSPFS